jgi:hypothetical protein
MLIWYYVWIHSGRNVVNDCKEGGNSLDRNIKFKSLHFHNINLLLIYIEPNIKPYYFIKKQIYTYVSIPYTPSPQK